MNSQRIIAFARALAVGAGLAGVITVYHRWLHVNPTTVALTLLLGILLLASKWGLRYAVAASLAATLAYNYYFLPPLGTLTIADPQNWLALLAFLATAVIASRLSARIREEAEEARKGQREVEMLFHLSRELLQTDNVTELIHAVPGSIALVCQAVSVLLFVEDGGRVYRAGVVADAPPDAQMLRELMRLPAASRIDGRHGVAVPLRAGVKPRGVLVVEGVTLSDETLEAMGGLVSIAIDRAQALEDVTRVEASKESERLRSVMLDSITHELRTPLTSIKAAATTLLSQEPVSEGDLHELLTVIDEESDRLNHLVAQAVEMAQLDSREIQMHCSPQSVRDLVWSAREGCGAQVSVREIRVEIPSALPPVLADPAWIQKVLCNLLDNAVKYSRAGEPVVVSADVREEMVRISVADRGAGIDPVDQSMIFDKFYRARAQTERVPGTGMGLAISRAIIDAHQGTISVVSQPGRGSVFTFTLRLCE